MFAEDDTLHAAALAAAVKARDVSEWLASEVIPFSKSLQEPRITFHDPCHAARFFFPALIFAAYIGMTSSLIVTNIYQVCIGVIIGIGTILYYEGLKRLKAAQVSGLELSTPFFAAILAFLFLNEFITIIQIIGILLLLGGVYLISKKEK